MTDFKCFRRHALIAGAGLALLATPVLAQTVGELTVTGRMGDAQQMSAGVSYADLDLTRTADQDMLKTRIKDTAKDLCRQLGEANQSSGPLVPSCEQAAYNDSQDQLKQAIESAPARMAAMAPPAADAAMVSTEPAAAPPAMDASAVDTTMAQPATVTTSTVTNGPVADTPENRARYGQPLSNAGRRTQASGN